MLKRAQHATVAWLMVMVMCGACRKNEQEPRWDIDVAVPLVRTTLTIGDLIGDSLVSADGQGNVSIVYTARLFALGLDTLMGIPDTGFHYRYPTDNLIPLLPFTLFPGAVIPLPVDPIRFDLDQLELRELRVRSGVLELGVVNRLGTVMLADLRLERAVLNGSEFQTTLSVPSGSVAAPSFLSSQLPLDGYAFDLRGPQFNQVNLLRMLLDLRTIDTGPTVNAGLADSLEVNVSYRDIKPRYARGYFGQRNIDLDMDTSRLNAFDGMSGLLDIDDVTAVLRVRNGIGVDMRARAHQIVSVNRDNGTVVPLQHTITASALNLDRALDLGNGFQAATNSWTLNTSNSNIDAFIENLPGAIAYDIDVVTNPLGDVSNGHDFFYDDSELTADLDIDLPLRVIATDLTLSRRTTVELEGTLQHHALQSGTLHVFAKNRFPFSARALLSLETIGGEVLDTLYPGGTIAAAPVSFDGLVTGATASQVDFTISKEQVDLLYPGSAAGADGARLRITLVFNTADQAQHLQLRADHTVDISISLEGNYIVNGDE